MFDLIIKNANIYDGLGAKPIEGDIGIIGSQISAIEYLGETPARQIIDVKGKSVSPGFIDIHSHSDFTLLVDGRALSALMQGVTTIVTGNCGSSCAPITDKELIKWAIPGYSPRWNVEVDWYSFDEYLTSLKAAQPALNVFPLVGHGTLRMAVMGMEYRSASDDELEKMKRLLHSCLADGARGFSTGLEYYPGAAADFAELRQLVQELNDGYYSTHLRNRNAYGLLDSVIEGVKTVKETNTHLQFSHLAPRSDMEMSRFDEVYRLLREGIDEGMSIGYDTLVYDWGPDLLTELVPWQMREGSFEEIAENLKKPETQRLIVESAQSFLQYLLSENRSQEMWLACASKHPEWVGMNLQQIADKTGKDILDVVMEILIAEGVDLMTVTLRTPYTEKKYLDKLMVDPHCVPMSDGADICLDGPFKGFDFIRGSYGWAARFLQYTLWENDLLTTEEAIRRLTSLPASYLRLSDRGQITRGKAADLVVFDEHSICDRSGEWGAIAYAGGIAYVVVNGEIVVYDSEFTDKRAGQIL